jgi:ubiquinone/menaquinone biosynthesis C-methylase UbiE
MQNSSINCDALAPYYNVLERLAFGKFLEHTRCAFLNEATTSRRAILCGDGDGRFLARLLQVNSSVNVDFVDLSHKMVQLAERRVACMGPPFRDRVRFHACDVRNFVPQLAGYDLIVTHFFLDCFSDAELPGVVATLANWADPDASWIVSEFCKTEGPIGRVWTQAVIRCLYAAFRFTTGLRVTRLPNYVGALEREGYSLSCEKKILGGLLRSSLWAV